jgi:hypothetical protein
MANRRFIDFPIASTVGENDIVLIWQSGANKQTTKATLLSGVAKQLNDLTDVTITSLANGQILQYDSVTGQWINVDRTDIDLSELGDVSIISPTNGQVLVYNSSTSKWENSSGGYVPYVGAVTTVDLGLQGLEAGFIRLDTSITSPPTGQGTMYWDQDEETVAIILNGSTTKVGEDIFFQVKNQSGATIPKGTAVRFDGVVGASGRIKIVPFLANGSNPSIYFLGVTYEAIADGADGKALFNGKIRGVNTSAFTVGDILYASPTVAGGFTTTKPVASNNIISVAAVLSSGANGILLIRPQIGSNINNDEGVKITSPTTGDLLQLQASGLWENKTISGAGLISGTIASGQVAFGTAAGVIGGDAGLTWDNVNKRLGVGTSTPTARLHVQAPGALSTDIAFLVRNSADTANLMSVNALGISTINAVNENVQLRIANTGVANNRSAIAFTFNNSGTDQAMIRALPGVIVGSYGRFAISTYNVFGGGMVDRMLFDEYGGVSIGATYAQNVAIPARLDIRAQGALGTDIAFRVRNSADSANLLNVRGNGNIGINTTTDAGFRLDVNGTARVQGNLTISATSSGTVSTTVKNSSTGILADTRLIVQNDANKEGGLFIGSSTRSPDANNVLVYANNQLKFMTNNTVSTGGTDAIVFQAGGNNSSQEGMRVTGSKNILIGTTSDITSAKLVVTSTTQGFLPPRMTNAQRLAIASPATGLQLYNTTNNTLDYYNGTSWNSVIAGSGTLNRLAKFTAAGTVGDSQIFDNGTNVGIGTDSPSSKLDVNETSSGAITNCITLTNASNTINTEAGLFFAPTTATGNIRGARITGLQEDGNNLIGLKFYTGVGETISEKMRITSGGNVLIGTPTGAGFRLDVNGSLRANTRVNFASLPTSSSGLVSGDLWINGTVINIIP